MSSPLVAAGTVLLSTDTSPSPETTPPYTVIYGEDSDRRIWDRSTEVTERNLRQKHIEYLREIIPKCVAFAPSPL